MLGSVRLGSVKFKSQWTSAKVFECRTRVHKLLFKSVFYRSLYSSTGHSWLVLSLAGSKCKQNLFQIFEIATTTTTSTTATTRITTATTTTTTTTTTAKWVITPKWNEGPNPGLRSTSNKFRSGSSEIPGKGEYRSGPEKTETLWNLIDKKWRQNFGSVSIFNRWKKITLHLLLSFCIDDQWAGISRY